jgi:transcriptional regulator with XRE-family HTH domain
MELLLEVPVAFGRVLRRQRVSAGLTQEQLGFESTLQRNYISTLERGQQQPTLTSIFKLSASLGVPASKLIELTEAEIISAATRPKA